MLNCACATDLMLKINESSFNHNGVSLLLLLSKQQQHTLASLVRVDDPDTKRKVITQNLSMVVNIANRYSDYGVAVFDLIREGNQGLIHALECFDLESYFCFADHVARCVRQNIECFIMNQVEPE